MNVYTQMSGQTVEPIMVYVEQMWIFKRATKQQAFFAKF